MSAFLEDVLRPHAAVLIAVGYGGPCRSSTAHCPIVPVPGSLQYQLPRPAQRTSSRRRLSRFILLWPTQCVLNGSLHVAERYVTGK
jgi:hypothetical protein